MCEIVHQLHAHAKQICGVGLFANAAYYKAFANLIIRIILQADGLSRPGSWRF